MAVDEGPGAAVLHDVPRLLTFEHVVHGGEHQSGLGRRDVELDVFDAGARPNGHPVTRFKPKSKQTIGKPGASAVEIPVAQFPMPVPDRNPVGIACRGSRDDRPQMLAPRPHAVGHETPPLLLARITTLGWLPPRIHTVGDRSRPPELRPFPNLPADCYVS